MASFSNPTAGSMSLDNPIPNKNTSAPHTHDTPTRNPRHDPRHLRDRPLSRHALPGHAPWVLVRTRYGRRFVHNTHTGVSLWRVPAEVEPGVRAFEREGEANEFAAHTGRAEETAEERATSARRRRSESLQREDEQAMMQALAETNGADVVDRPGTRAAEAAPASDSDSSYEEVEVTDSESEADAPKPAAASPAPLEFGEDDMAHQLAALASSPEPDSASPSPSPSPPPSPTPALHALFTTAAVNPFTPFPSLPTTLTTHPTFQSHPNPHTAWTQWSRSALAARAARSSSAAPPPPTPPFLALLHRHASPTQYWPDFRRRFKRHPALTDRRLPDRQREALYRAHVRRLRLDERVRRADLWALLREEGGAGRGGDGGGGGGGGDGDDGGGGAQGEDDGEDTLGLPPRVTGDVRFISLPREERDGVVREWRAATATATARAT